MHANAPQLPGGDRWAQLELTDAFSETPVNWMLLPVKTNIQFFVDINRLVQFSLKSLTFS